MRKPGVALVLAAVAAATACRKPQPALLYEPEPVTRRDVVVTAEANGSVQPIQIVAVKSRASGTILEMRVETGDMVHIGDTLVKVDRRDPTTTYNQAQADLEVAQAQASNAAAQKRRADEMFAAGVLSEQDHDNATLADANARAQLVRAQAGLQSALDALTDCNVLAPVDGTILVKNVEAGGVITSAVRDVSGGTVLLQMADLSTVEVQALVDETDIGKVQAGMPVTITVDAYPNRLFRGTVLKIEPQSTVTQNVTMFAVLVNIPNPEGLLRPGMNAQVAVQIGQRQNVLAIPTAALRTERDMGSAAQVLGLDPRDVSRQLAAQDSLAQARVPAGREAAADPPRTGGAVEGGSVAPLRAAGPAGAGTNGSHRRFGEGNSYHFGGSYVVFALRDGRPAPVRITTGLTDMDYSEVLSGLAERDTVLLLPSASLVQQQADMRDRMQRFAGSPVPGMQQQSRTTTRTATPATPPPPPPPGGGR